MAERKPHLVIFCGAGFCAPFGFPVMRNFSDKLRESGFLGSRQQEFDSIQRQCDALGAFIGGSARNLEDLASFFRMLTVARPEFEFQDCKDYRKPERALRLVMEGVRHLLTRDVNMGSVQHKCADLFRLYAGAEISFITTNYDMLIEHAAASQNMTTVLVPEAEPLFCSAPGPRTFYNPHAPNRVKLYKLHGSVNWYEGAGPPKPTIIFNEVEGNTEMRAGTRSLRIPAHDCPGDCMLVPPSVLKPAVDGFLATQWRGASQALATADVLWFVGYSFPETDSFMRFFLASSLFSNPQIKQLAVIDPSREVCRRAQSIFTLPSLSQVFQSYPVEWEHINFGALLAGHYLNAVKMEGMKAIQERDNWWRVMTGDRVR